MLPFAERLIAWQRVHGRHDLPWQKTRDPYRVWLSEIMLQQTRVATVIPYYQRFVERFPDIAALAAAPVEEVMALWSGLGYYARARNLHECALTIVRDHAGRFPHEPEAIAALPGIGRSTAHAIAIFCFGARLPILDGNVKRILCRHRGIEGWPGGPAVETQLWQHASALLPDSETAVYIQAQMDLGATVCTRARPDCTHCPVAGDCVARRDGRTGELPAPRPRKALPERETTVLVLRRGDGRVLLVPRPPAGIWGGLWSLPEADGDPDAEAARLGCRIVALRPQADALHAFTHFRLRMKPLICDVVGIPSAAEPEARWLGAHELAAAPLPAPVRRLLESALSGFP